ncbi:protein adenylyltransferase SelO [Roseateles amylovorans]|uniref:Protein nucleotidyltransferase YdiU n=1 Tax=Roseateles amylovorans TaxID=2978473 RepID=A0ABY6B0Z7_9BURK|nr:YdiU family protein [Roseateles amylovorans]UXH77208.1 YdiU family protein [Roseateles amylovorans]
MNAPEMLAPPWSGTDATAWTNRFAALGPDFFTELNAAGLPDPHWVATSPDCAALLGWPQDWWQQPGALAVFSGNARHAGMRPLASVYSGHQFGAWAGQLGDGRALWVGELGTPNGPMELQLKGAGPTPYSRRGDGRAVLRSSIREFLCSEAMAGLGIPTTRALCITGSTALPVRRETLETSAVVTRVAPSFLRFGHFEHFAHHGLPAQLRTLFDFFVQHYAPECADAPQPVTAVLAKVAGQTAELIAQWQAVGFMHGVMNTDNMSMLGLTLDYGPFGFMDGFDPGHICNHSDHQGRYAFARQPQIGFWNLHALAQALLPLMPNADTDAEAAGDDLLEALEVYRERFGQAMLSAMRAKLGLLADTDAAAEDGVLVDDWLRLLSAHRTDYTIAHRRLAAFRADLAIDDPAQSTIRDLFLDRAAFDAWAQRYAARLNAEPADASVTRAARMNAVNPAVVLRNHLAETAIQRAQAGDFSEVERLLAVLRHPFDEPARAADADFPPDWAQQLEVSCSS